MPSCWRFWPRLRCMTHTCTRRRSPAAPRDCDSATAARGFQPSVHKVTCRIAISLMVRLMREPVDAACFAMVAIAQAAVRAALVVMPIGAVRRTGAYSTCLVRALVAEMLLTGIDRPMRLMIGVRRAADSRLESHAWIERDGRVIVGGAGGD